MKRIALLSPLAVGVALMVACSSEEGSGIDNNAGGQGGAAASGTGATSTFTGGAAGGVSADGGGAAGAAGAAGTPTTEPPPCDAFIGLDNQMECGADTATAQIKQANMLIVLDKSGSMTAPLGSSTLWDATKTALTGALQAVQGIVSFGLILFPDKDVPFECPLDVCCQTTAGNMADVPVADGTLTVPQIIDTLNTTAPGGGTPIAAGLTRALEYYTTGTGAALQGDKFVMLVTDGGPNCNAGLTCDSMSCTMNLDLRQGCTPTGANCCAGEPRMCLDDDAVLAQINALSAAGIATFVVGIPGTENYASYLDTFATAGGRAQVGGATQYYAVSESGGVAGLESVFTDITTQLINSCDVTLSRVPPDPTEVNVAVNCEALPRVILDDSGAVVSGDWDLDLATDPPTVRLLGSTCDYITQTGAERIDVIFGCPSIM